jgi:hypothetical protein
MLLSVVYWFVFCQQSMQYANASGNNILLIERTQNFCLVLVAYMSNITFIRVVQ